MIGYDEAKEVSTTYDLLGAKVHARDTLKAKGIKVGAAVSLALVGMCGVAMLFAKPATSPVATAPQPAVSLSAASDEQWHGVSLGGWLLMEINPSKRDATSPMDLRPGWMFDQIEEHSELDFVTTLRKEHGEQFAPPELLVEHAKAGKLFHS